MTTPSRDIRRFRLISTAPAIVEPRNRRMRFDPATFRDDLIRMGKAPLLADHLAGMDRVGGRIVSAAVDAARGAVYGAIEIFSDAVPAAARIRALLDAGHKGASVEVRPGRLERANDRARDVFDWEIGHLAIVAQGADPTAGPEDFAVDLEGYESPDYVFHLELIPEGQAMPENFEVNFDELLPKLATGIAEAVVTGLDSREQARLAAQQAAEQEAADKRRIAELEAALAAKDAPPNPDPEPAPASAPEVPGMMAVAKGLAGEVYDTEGLADVEMDLAAGEVFTAAEFREKLESVRIQPKAIARGLSNEGDYNVNRAIQSLMHGDVAKDAPVEYERSSEILRATNMSYDRRSGSPGLAIPLSEIAAQRVDGVSPSIRALVGSEPDVLQLSARQGGASYTGNGDISTGVPDPIEFYYRNDLPDPLDMMPLVTTMPSGPGDPRLIAVETPAPVAATEPGTRTNGTSASGGYSEDGDVQTSQKTIIPTILKVYTSVTRLADVNVPNVWNQAGTILMDRMTEKKNESLIDALYAASGNAAGITKRGDLTNTAIAREDFITAINNSWLFENMPGANRRFITTLGVTEIARNIAEPSAVAAFSDGMSVRGVPFMKTGHLANDQAIVGPLSLIRLKNWDGSVYVSTRYEAGIMYLLLELFWGWNIIHPGQLYRVTDST